MKQKQKTVKGWGIIYFEKLVSAFVDKKTARDECVETEDEIIRCTITYTLPKSKNV